MRPVLLLAGMAFLILAATACESISKKTESYKVDHLEISPAFQKKKPANLVILPIDAVKSLDIKGRNTLRKFAYDNFIKKGYAPLSITFTDRTLREIGRHHTPICNGTEWNRDPFMGAFSDYVDAVVLFSIERYQEAGQANRYGIEIWGKVGIFDASSMDLLFEYYTRQSLHPTDPGGGRDRIIQKALEEFSDLIFLKLPARGESRK